MKTILVSLCAVALLSTTVACRRDPARPAQGPAERAGQKVDQSAGKAADETKAAGKKVEEDAKDAKETVKRKAD